MVATISPLVVPTVPGQGCTLIETVFPLVDPPVIFLVCAAALFFCAFACTEAALDAAGPLAAVAVFTVCCGFFLDPIPLLSFFFPK